MKNLFTALFLVLALSFTASAQYCGSSQISNCGLPSSTYGFGNLNNYPCLTRNMNDSIVMKFKTYSQFTVGTAHVNILKLKIDSIENLPCGICWSSNKPTNEFVPNEDGCIIFHGMTHDKVGHYKLRLILDVATQNANIYDQQGIDADASGSIYLQIRVKNAGGVCDTVVNMSTQGNAKDCTYTGIEELTNNLSSLSIHPNPVSGEAKVAFYTDRVGEQQLRIISIVGTEMYNTTINAKPGMNEVTINRNNLAEGIYFLSIGSGKATLTKKFIVSE